MSKVSKLREALLDTLIDRVSNGETVLKDGELVTLPASAAVLTVAAKVCKDFAEDTASPEVKASVLSDTLKRYQDRYGSANA